MAAGLSIHPQGIFCSSKKLFLKLFLSILMVKNQLLDLVTDGELEASEMTLKNAQLLCKFSPMGSGF